MSTTHTAPKLVETLTAQGVTAGITWSVFHVTQYRGNTADYYRAVVSGETVSLGSHARFNQAEAIAAAERIAEHDAADRAACDARQA